MRKYWLAAAVALILVGAFLASLFAPRPSPSVSSGVLQVVAAENFWGSLASQIGGTHVRVLSIVSDPNADPHEYESNTADARAFANADYVILNGAGYDSWGNKLLGANPDPTRKVLNVAQLLGKKEGDNPHFWYSPAYVNEVAARMEQDLISLDPVNASYYQAQYRALQAALASYQDRIASIKQQFGGTKVAATEDIFSYLAQAAGLDLVSPSAFIQAVAEGNDPPAQSVVEFQNQLMAQEPAVLVYNQQTVTPLTENMKALAAREGIPVVGMTETVQPPGAPFEDWMDAQVLQLQDALAARAPGH